MSAFGSFYFIDETVDRLKLGVCGEKSPHAYLFCGPEGAGKRSLAAVCSRAVNCLAGSDKPCDKCPSCEQYLADSHPDHIVLRYQGKAVGVAAVRELIERLGYRPFEGGSYTVIIERADMMTAQAQNALLKTLEEPPSKAVFFLLAENEQGLLPTVRSRCRLVRIPILTVDECAQALMKKGLEEKRARSLAEASQGSVGKALSLETDEEYWALRQRVLTAVSLVKSPSDVSRASSQLKDDSQRALTVVEIIEQMAQDALRSGEGLPGGENDMALRPDRLLEGLINLRRMLASNVSWQSSLEKTLFEALV